MRVWNVASGQRIGVFGGHQVEAFGFAFSPDERILASGDWDGVIAVWDLVNAQQLLSPNSVGRPEQIKGRTER